MARAAVSNACSAWAHVQVACRARLPQRDGRCEVHRVPVDPRGDRRERDRASAQLPCHRDAGAMRGGEQLRVLRGAGVHRTHRVDDPASGQVPGRGGHCLTGRQSRAQGRGPQPLALLEDGRATCPVDRAVDSPTTEQGAVGGVDDHIGVEGRDVTEDESHAHEGSVPHRWVWPRPERTPAWDTLTDAHPQSESRGSRCESGAVPQP